MIIIAIGHSRTGDSGGAAAVDGTREHAYNSVVGRMAARMLEDRGIRCQMIDRYPRQGYGEAMTWLAGECRRLSAEAVLELHFNAATPQAHGAEYLVWPGSVGGTALARSIIAAHRSEVPATTFRRDAGVYPRSSGNGAQFLRVTPCPAVLTEPFFGTNAQEWGVYGTDQGKERLASIYADGIANWLGVAPVTRPGC